MKNLIFIILTTMFIQGCATSYQQQGLTGGYSETQLDENVFRVSFVGNGYTRPERAADFALLRSAELALQNGYQYFAIVDSNSGSSYSAHTTPTTYNTTGSAYSTGNYAYGSATTTSSGGQTYIISKPSSSNTVVLFKEKPSEVFTYNAKFIYKNISEKYGINQQ